VLGDLLGEVPVVADDEDSVASVDELSAQLFVPGSLGGLVVDGAVAEEVEVGGVEEVGDAGEVGDGFLGFVGEAVVAGGEGFEEAAFEVGTGVGEGVEPGEVGGAVAACLAGEGVAGGEVEEGLADGVAVELEGFVLVVEAHEALVASGLAVGFLVGALVVEVATGEGFSRGAGDGAGFVDEAAEDSGSSFGGFVEEDGAVLVAADSLGGELGFFELEELLAAALEGVLEGGDLAGIVAQVGADEEDVLGALDGEADAFCAARARVVGLGGLGADVSALEVDEEAGGDLGAEAVVDAQEGGGRGVDEVEDGGAVDGDVRFLDAGGSGFLGELEAGLEVVAAAAALFFVAGDAFAAAGADVGHFEEGDDLAVVAVEARLADGAEVERGLAVGAAGAAEALGPPPLVQASGRGLEGGDLPLGAFVVEDVVGARIPAGRGSGGGR